jgi:uncharacterized protein YcgI (DUF1989 family)
LDCRDLVANVNFFTKVATAADGELSFVAGHSQPGSLVCLRFELDTLVVLASAVHPLDPAEVYRPRPVRLLLERVQAAGEDDPVRVACAENERGFAACEAVLA